MTLLSATANAAAQINPPSALLVSGSPSTNPFTPATTYNGGGLTGPTSFGPGGSVQLASSGSGNIAGIQGAGTLRLIVPQGYVSNSPLTDTSTYNNATFATLGFTPGTYTYTWGTGANADSLTVTSVVPEPGTWALLGLGVVGLGLVLRQRRRPAPLA